MQYTHMWGSALWTLQWPCWWVQCVNIIVSTCTVHITAIHMYLHIFHGLSQETSTLTENKDNSTENIYSCRWRIYKYNPSWKNKREQQVKNNESCKMRTNSAHSAWRLDVFYYTVAVIMHSLCENCVVYSSITSYLWKFPCSCPLSQGYSTVHSYFLSTCH